MGKLFGTFGIRGVANEELTPKLAFDLGLALATQLGNEGKVAVAHDPRTSSSMLEQSLISGLVSGGCHAVGMGMIPTPVLSFGISHFSCDAGVMITASHNPPEYNGMKFWDEMGAGFVRDREREIERILEEGAELVSWSDIGSVNEVDALKPYMTSLLDRVPEFDCDLKIVVDCANGAGSVVTPKLLTALGCKVISMNSYPDGRFPGRMPEPTAENLGDLMNVVTSIDADMGIAHDGDADRTMIVNERGELLSGDRVFALVALHYLRKTKNPKIITTVSTSSVLDDVAERLEGEVVRTAVGEPEIIGEFRKSGGDLGGEENGGVIFPNWAFCRDGIMTAIQFVSLVARSGVTVSEVDETLPKYWQFKQRTRCPDELKPKVLEILGKELDHYNPDRTDGFRVTLDDGWFIVRPSGTEPVFRCFSEARTQKRARKMAEEGMEAVKESIKAAKD